MQNGSDDAPLAEYMWILLRGWKISVLCALLTASLGTAYAYFVPVKYRAVTIVAPVANENSLLSAALAAAGPLSSILGDRNMGMSPTALEAIVALQSEGFLRTFVNDHDLMPLLFPDRWDHTTSSWKKRAFSGPPNLSDAYELLSDEVLRITQDADTGFWSVSLLWPDRKQATSWLQLMLDDINELQRTRDLIVSKEAVKYLEESLNETSNIQVRNAMYSLIEAQLRVQVMANVRNEYALKFVSPVTVPDENHFEYPNRKMLIIFSLLGGLALGVVAAFVRADRTAVRKG